MTWLLRGLALALAALLLANNIAAAKGDVPVIVTMIAIAFLPLLFERSARGGILVIAFLALWVYVLPSAIERAGAQRAQYLETRAQHEAGTAAVKKTRELLVDECSTGYGAKCKGLGYALQAVGEQVGDAPPPSGVAMLTALLGISDVSLGLKALTLLNALGSEIAVAVLIHMAVFFTPVVPPAPRERERPPPPDTAADFLSRHLDSVSRVVAAELFNLYLDEWQRRGARTMSRSKFMAKLQDAAGRHGFRRRSTRGKIIYEREE